VKTLARVLALLLVAAFSLPAAAAHPLTKRYLDGLFRAKPHLATFMGDHRFDGALPDRSPAGLRARERELVALSQALGRAKSRAAAKLDDEIDHAIIEDAVGLELLYLREIRDWEWDPRLYDSFPCYDPREIVAGRLSDIIHGDFAPPAARLASVRAQLAALPRFLEQTTAALRTGKRHPPEVYVAQAIKTNPGRIELLETEVKAFVKASPASEAARAKAVEALRRYQAFLETELAGKRNDGDWRLGADLYARKFKLALQTDRTPAEVAPRAEAAFRVARAELGKVAGRLHLALWPSEPLPREPGKLIARVKDEISRNHAKPDELVEAHGRNLDELRAFITKHDLLELPPKDTLAVEPMPAFKRGSAAAEYLAPGVLERRGDKWRATYYVDPIDPAWPPEKVESYLRGQNTYEVQLVAAHEAYPGHHTQFFYARRDLNPLRATLWNAPMVEGWAVYGEGLMVERGWGGADNDRFRFYDLRGDMVVATNVLLDIRLHSGQMKDDEALRLMIDEGFQEQATAEKKLLRAKLDSTQLAQYFLGLDEIRTLEADHRQQVGASFSQRAFNEALIGHGSIAVRHLRRYLLK
jgi:uncharacterized protein (DUF885 family)